MARQHAVSPNLANHGGALQMMGFGSYRSLRLVGPLDEFLLSRQELELYRGGP